MTSTARLLRDHRAMAGLGILGVLVFAGLFAPLLAPADPLAQADVLTTRFLPPLATGPDGVLHWLGTDGFGRDLLSRMLYGARISLFVGILSVAISITLGGAVGFAAGLVGGRVERLLMAVTDAVLAMPRLILLLALVTLWQSSILLIVLVLGFTGWMSVARLARAEVKGLLARPFVEAARAAGAGRWHVLTRHLMPNSLTPVIVAAALAVGNAIMLEAGLSFLGLGIPAPSPSWGNMIAEGRQALVNAPWIATFPGIAVVLAVIGCNLLGDGVRDVLDPTVLSHRQRIKKTATPPTRAA
jgi:peptide/nickel transport system permease protein